MSGKESSGYHSEFYGLVIAGGISSWDYDRIRENSLNLDQALLQEQSTIDLVVKQQVELLDLKIVKYDLENLPSYIDGVLIEEDQAEELFKKEHFCEYFDSEKSNSACADISQFIDNTSFEIVLSVLVTERIHRVDMQQLLKSIIECVVKSDNLSKLLY